MPFAPDPFLLGAARVARQAFIRAPALPSVLVFVLVAQVVLQANVLYVSVH